MRRTDERGIALPVTLFIMTLLTIMLAASFTRVGAEREMAVGASDAVSALTIAQGGLQRYFGSRTSTPPDGDSVRFNLTGGYADVVARIVQRPANPVATQTYVVRSTGYVIVPVLGATTRSRRSVAQFARWQPGVMRLLAAFTAANDLAAMPGGQIVVAGTDQCQLDTALASVRLPQQGSLTRGNYTPQPPGPVSLGNKADVANGTGIDWPAIVGGGFVPDYPYITTTGGTWKSYLVNGDATLSSSGTGLLIVTNDLEIKGNGTISWLGVILVGGEIKFTARRIDLYGAVISGLNEQLGGTPPQQGKIGGGTKHEIQYSSCDVANALATIAGLVPIPNAWVDNWATY